MKVSNAEVPESVKDAVHTRQSKYWEVYESISLVDQFNTVCVECDDEDEARKISAAVRSWAYRYVSPAEDGKRHLPLRQYLDGDKLWIEWKKV